MSVSEKELFQHFSSVLRRPARCGDRPRGSQQCAFEITVPSSMAEKRLFAGLPYLQNKKYSVDKQGEVVWLNSPSIDTYYEFDRDRLVAWISLHKRGVVNLRHPSYASSKGVHVTKEHGLKVVATLISPLLVELCHRSHGKLVATVAVNLMTGNDLGSVELPPAFEYAAGEREALKLFSLSHVAWMVAHNRYKVSPQFRQLVRQNRSLIASRAAPGGASSSTAKEMLLGSACCVPSSLLTMRASFTKPAVM
eukprot:6193869-Pleurochrysis_carterae.AAC.1